MVYDKHCFSFRTTFFSVTDSFQCSLIQTFQNNLVNSLTEYSLVIQNSCYTYYAVFCHSSCTIVLSQLSSLTIIYFIFGVKLCSLTFLVAISANCRPPFYQSILFILHFSPFLIYCIILVMCLVCLVSLPFLSIYIEDLLSSIIRGYSYGPISVSLFNNS